jgi:hypothetical protein
MVVKLLGTGIGLASEAIAAHKLEKQAEKKKQAARASGSTSPFSSSHAEASSSRSVSAPPAPYHQYDDAPDSPPPAYDSEYVELPEQEAERMIEKGQALPVHDYPDDKKAPLPEFEEDEEDWALDEAARSANPAPYDAEEEENKKAPKGVDEIVKAFIAQYPPPPPFPAGMMAPRLFAPVIIPQRRPKDKKRGFVRAYAPALEECGVDQKAFLGFLKNWGNAAKVCFSTHLLWVTIANMIYNRLTATSTL